VIHLVRPFGLSGEADVAPWLSRRRIDDKWNYSICRWSFIYGRRGTSAL